MLDRDISSKANVCPNCENVELEMVQKLHTSTVGYGEKVDEKWQCNNCHAEYRVAFKPIIVNKMGHN